MGHVREKSDAGETAVKSPRLPAKLAAAAEPTRRVGGASPHHFDKAFPVHLSSDRGVANGVGRNISPQGMFIETREPCTIGTEVRVTFTADSLGTEIVAVGEVRFQCYLNYSGDEGKHEGLRGMGIRFLRFEEPERAPRKPVVRH